ncbi:hypothetical protein NOR_02170 [Metarhizium rileyi]|nr:hypothetical protein NOR_02170 [Metarhizium rileyi RCEF 4871]
MADQKTTSTVNNAADDVTSQANTAGDQAKGGLGFVTSTLGNTVGGVSRTVGGVTGAATKGVGDTVNSVGGETLKPVGDGVSSLGGGLQGGIDSVAGGVENAGNLNK